jgi:D-alanine-D-alanine ligase
VIKPAQGGSSYGITIVKNKKDIDAAIKLAKKYDDEVIMEEYIKGVEVSCGVVGEGRALPVIEICPKNGFFDYESKYVIGKCKEIVPARISEKVREEIQQVSSLIFKKMECRGFARLDFIVKNEISYLLEINMVPGLTPNSLLPKEAAEIGIGFKDLMDLIIQSSF